MYHVFIHPHLKYCVQAWCPYLCRDIDKLEKVQRKATKLLPNLTHLSNPDRLKNLGLYSLYYQHICGDLILTYINIIIKIDINTFSQLKLYKPPVKHLERQKFLTNRIINEWINLPECVILSATLLNDFKIITDNEFYGHSERPMA